MTAVINIPKNSGWARDFFCFGEKICCGGAGGRSRSARGQRRERAVKVGAQATAQRGTPRRARLAIAWTTRLGGQPGGGALAAAHEDETRSKTKAAFGQDRTDHGASLGYQATTLPDASANATSSGTDIQQV